MSNIEESKTLLKTIAGHKVPEWLINIGVDIGEEAWQFAEKFPGIKILGVDPTPQRNPNWMNYPGELISGACSSKDGVLEMFREPADAEGGTFLIASETPDSLGQVDVPCFTLDTLNKSRKFHNAVLWLDVEGHELEILQGAEELLKSKQVQWIYCEVRSKSPYSTTPHWCTAGHILKTLVLEHHYRIYQTLGLHKDLTIDTGEPYVTDNILFGL